MQQLDECLGALDVTLDESLERAIEAIHQRYPNPNKHAGIISPGFVYDVRKGV